MIQEDVPPYHWLTVKVHVLSSMHDMYAERESLVKNVFPELRKWCKKWRLNLVITDLWWEFCHNILLEQDTSFNILLFLGGNICDNIPFLKRSQQLTSFLKTSSAFFYFRSPNSLPKIKELQGFSIQEQEQYKYAFFSDSTSQVEQFKSQIIDFYKEIGRDKVFHYEAIFNQTNHNPEKLDLPGRITQQSLTIFRHRVRKDLKNAISQLFQQRIETLWTTYEYDLWQEEWDYHEAFVENISANSMHRFDIEKVLEDYVYGETRDIFVLHGEEGVGKSATLGQFYKYIRDRQDSVCIPHFISASPNSGSIVHLLTRLCVEIQKRCYISEVSEDFTIERKQELWFLRKAIPTASNELTTTFKEFLKGTLYRLVIIIDGLDRLDPMENSQLLLWLPKILPYDHVKIIVSTQPGEILEKLKGKNIAEMPVGTLNRKETEQIICQHPLENVFMPHITKLLNHIKNPTPFYLKLCLHFLKNHHSSMEEGLKLLPETVEELFQQQLQELETAYEMEYPGLVSMFFSLLASSKEGLTSEELGQLLLEVNEDDTYKILLYQIDDFLYEEGTLFVFSYKSFARAVENRYLSEKASWHQYLAGYFDYQPLLVYTKNSNQTFFNTRKLVELPWQLLHGKMWQTLEETLTSIDFLRTKISAHMTLELQYDYQNALKALLLIPTEPFSKMISYARKLREYSTSWSKAWDNHNRSFLKRLKSPKEKIPSPPKSVRVLTQEDALQERLSKNLLQELHEFIKKELYNLCSLGTHYSFCFEEYVYNNGSQELIAKINEQLQKTTSNQILALLPKEARPRDSQNSIERVFQTEFPVTKAIISWDGSIVIAADKTKTKNKIAKIYVWETKSGDLRYVFDGSWQEIRDLVLTPDGSILVSASADRICVWDMTVGKCIRTIEDKNNFYSISEKPFLSISPDGRWLTVRTFGGSSPLCFLDLQCGEIIENFGGWGEANGLALSTDSRHALAGEEEIKVWDLRLDKSYILKEKSGPFVLLPNEILIVQKTREVLEVFDLKQKGKKIDEIALDMEYLPPLSHLALVTLDRSLAIFKAEKNSFVIWDCIMGKYIKTLPGEFFDASRDGKWGISGKGEFGENAIVVWDLEFAAASPTRKKHRTEVHSINISRDKSRVFSLALGERMYIWEAYTGNFLENNHHDHSITSTIGYNLPWGVDTGDYNNVLWNMAGSDDIRCYIQGNKIKLTIRLDETIAIIASGDYLIYYTNGRCSPEKIGRFLNLSTIMAFALSPDGQTIVSSESDRFDPVLVRWNYYQPNEKAIFYEGHKGEVHCVCFSPNGRYVVSGGKDCTVRLWDAESGEALEVFYGHTEPIVEVKTTADFCHIVSASKDNTIRFWNVTTGECVRITILKQISSMDLQGEILAVGHKNGKVSIFHLQNILKGPLFVTKIRLFNQASKQWEADYSCLCPGCGIKIIIPDMGETFEREISSSFLSFAEEEFDNPHLLDQCENCGWALRYNPFIQDLKPL